MSVPQLAREASDRLHGLLKQGRIAKIDIDVIRAHCSAIAQYEMLAPMAAMQLEEATLRRVVESSK